MRWVTCFSKAAQVLICLVQYDALAFSYSRSREVSMIMRIVTAIEEMFLSVHSFKFS
jgi:hypothetical protein